MGIYKLMEENVLLRDAGSRMTRHADIKLGDVVTRLVEKQISPRQARFGQLADAWNQLLPAELRKHCRLADFSAGRLKVTADSSAYVYELQLCSDELLKQLQRQCPVARLTKIKVTIG